MSLGHRVGYAVRCGVVARGVPPHEVFAVVAKEVALVIPSIECATMFRYEADGTATVMARWAERKVLIDRVEALGGTIAVTSPPGQGTSMVLELPIELH